MLYTIAYSPMPHNFVLVLGTKKVYLPPCHCSDAETDFQGLN